jgi:hypothetical protein
MANLIVKDGNGNEKYIKKTGAGTDVDPFVEPSASVSLNTAGQIDSFGRLRVSQVNTFFDSKQLHDKQPLFWDEVDSGGAETSTHSTANAQTVMTTSNSGEYVIRQTFQRFNYQTGKSQQIFMTFGGFDLEANITKRVGYFTSTTVAPHNSSFDGLWLENDGTNVSIEVYRSGTQVFSVNQSAWDDPMDGSGASGQTIDWSKGQIMMIDFEWLGSGNPRFSFVIDSVIYPVHLCKNANVNALVYMSSPNQPLRYEIRQTGAGSGTLNHICSTVGSEGALNLNGKNGHAGQEVTSITLASTATTYPLIGLKLRSGYEDAVIDLITASILETSAKRVHWELVLNPTVTIGAGAFSYSNLTNYGIQYAIGDGTVTCSGGTVLSGGYVDASNETTELQNAIRLGVDIAGTLDEIILTGRPVSANAVVYSSIDFKELT